MAQIHQGKHGPRRPMRCARALTHLCWPAAVLSLALTALLYWQSGGRLLSLADGWRESFIAWAAAPGATTVFHEAWHQTLWQGLEAVLHGIGWTLWALTLGLPGLLGTALAVMMLCLFRPALEQYRQLRAQILATDAAMKLLAPMPDSCHIFLHKRIVFDGAAAQPEIILVGPGGVAVVEVRGEAGIIEGCVTDAALLWRSSDGAGEKLRNPARPAVANVTRLSNYLSSQGLRVHVTPCVIFVHPEANVHVSAPESLQSGGRRTQISRCVITDATSFWENMGRSFADGRVLGQTAVEQLVEAIRNAPEGHKKN